MVRGRAQGKPEDGGAVLRAIIRALTVQLRGIVVLPEDIQKLVIGNLCRIVFNFYGLRVPSTIGANVFVSRILGLSSGVADAG